MFLKLLSWSVSVKRYELNRKYFLSIIFFSIAINTWGSALFSLGEYPAWAAMANPECNITYTGLDLNGSLPSPAINEF